MKIRGRLVIAFLLMTLFPVFMCYLCVYCILHKESEMLTKNYNLEAESTDFWLNPYKLLYNITLSDYDHLEETARTHPDRFLDHGYLEKENKALHVMESFLIVKQNEKATFIGDKEKYQKMPVLPPFYKHGRDADSMVYMDHANSMVLREINFYFSNGSEGQIFIATDMSQLIPHWKNVLQELALSYFFIILATAILLLAWIYRSIIYPLNILRIATRQIGAGNLDQPVQILSMDEIGELCNDFEDMRLRLKQMVDERMHYDESIRTMISSISHDLKTPLTAIKGYTEGLMDGVTQTPTMQTKYLQTIYNKANDMTYLVDELSLLAQMEQDALTYQFRSVNVADFFSDCIEDLELDLAKYDIKLSYRNHTDPDICILADPEQLKRVINNISNNTVKYRKHGTSTLHICIGDGDLAGFIQVQIADEGTGIAEKDLPFIFDRFYRADASRNSSTGGSGLGLSIVQKIITDHGGRVWAESIEGAGTSINFLLKKAAEN